MTHGNEKTAARWVKMARAAAHKNMGTSAHLLTVDVRRALECATLIGIIAGLDESCRNADTICLAAEMIMSDNEET